MNRLLLQVILLGLFFPLSAQQILKNPAFNSSDAGFGFGDGFNHHVSVAAVQADGKILVGGYFTNYNLTTRNRMIRLNEDGSIDNTFQIGSGFNNPVTVLKVQPDGKILAGGLFESYNGIASNRLIRLNEDGTRDSEFSIGTGFNNSVNTIALQDDGKIIVGGVFTAFNGKDHGRIVRLNADGSLDETFDPGTGFDMTVMSIDLQDDGKIVAAGAFFGFNGTDARYIIRLHTNGARDDEFKIGSGLGWRAFDVKVLANQKILVAGDFTSYNGSGASRIIRLHADGTMDTGFTMGTGFNDVVHTIHELEDGRILAGGNFTTYNGEASSRAVMLAADGGRDASFDVGQGFNNRVETLISLPGSRVLAAGWFTSYNQGLSSRICILDTAGMATDFNFSSGFNGAVSALALQPDGKLLVGGSFTHYFGKPAPRIARLYSDGTMDESFNPGAGFNGSVSTFAIQSDGRILAGGYFTSFDGEDNNYLVRLHPDGTIDKSFDLGTGFSGRIISIYVQPDGKILAGGAFTSFNGTAYGRIIRINKDGSADDSFDTGGGFGGLVNTVTGYGDGRLVVGGSFTTFDGVACSRIIRLNEDGSRDSSFGGTGFGSGWVNTVGLLPDGKIIAAGNFSQYNGQSGVHSIVRINPDGTRDTGFSSPSSFGTVNSLVVQPNGKTIIVGSFSAYRGVSRNGIARLDRSGNADPLFLPGEGFNAEVMALVLNPDGDLIVGGGFVSYDGKGTNRLAKLLNFDVSIIGTDAPEVWCPEDEFEVNYFIKGDFGQTLDFGIELSDGEGSFFSPALMGRVSMQGLGVAKVVVPAGMPPGKNYKIRLSALDPFQDYHTYEDSFAVQGALAGSFEDVFWNTQPFVLEGGYPEGGFYTGQHIIEGKFDPLDALPGEHKVVYHYEFESGCAVTAEAVIRVRRTPQTIHFSMPDTLFLEVNEWELEAYATSQVEVEFALLEGDGTLSGKTLTINRSGYFTVAAIQEGSILIEPAITQERRFYVKLLFEEDTPVEPTDPLRVGGEKLASYALRLYPNPSDRLVMIEAFGSVAHSAMVHFIDLRGNIVLSADMGRVEAGLQLQADVSFLVPGLYLVVVNDGSRLYRTRFVKN
jgi:uncharacterized delta-60 repeat protein